MNYGRYEVGNEQDVLGKGAMGVVYRAHDPCLNRLVAIKVLHKKLLYDDEAVASFLKEAALNASLFHPNILTILDVGEERGEVYIAMELLEGRPLSKLMSTLSRQEILAIGMQIADGLDFAHKKKVVHRDIKPANIMVLHDGQIKITDFGIAKGGSASGEEHLETQTGVIKGTPAYMSPEQARGDSKNVDGRSDLFSLGVMLYEMSVGKRPFGGDGKDFMAVFGEILNKNPQEPCKANEAVERDLSAAIMKALQKDPARRFQSGSELYQALKACQKSGVPAAAKPDKKARITAAAGAALLLAAGGIFLSSSGKKVAPAPPAPVTVAPAPAPVPAPATSAQPGQALQLPLPVATGSPGTAHAPPAPAPAASASAPKEAAPSAPAPKVAAPKRVLETKHAKQPAKPSKVDEKSEAPGATGGEPPVAQPPVASSSGFAFLKVGSSPSGAQVYVNGALKGMTPLKVRLNLGRYKVRLSRSGFQDATTSVTLDKMAEFPIMQELKPE